MSTPCKSALSLSLLWLALAAGCSGDQDKPAPAAAMADPCALVTTAEVEAALGQAVQPPETKQTHNPLGQAICFYAAAGEDKVRFVQVSLVRTQGMTAAMRGQGYSAARLFEDTKALLQGPQEVPGLGSAAYFGGGGLRAGAGLHVLAADAYLTITVAGSDGQHDLDQAKTLAAKALARLK
ncbi:MAG: hypothetical protein HY794_19020 [Desulfarculus sp.]|nr:hypothetical protein [Desulfarculus sp.]